MKLGSNMSSTFVPFDGIKDVITKIKMAMQLSVVASTHLVWHHQLRNADT